LMGAEWLSRVAKPVFNRLNWKSCWKTASIKKSNEFLYRRICSVNTKNLPWMEGFLVYKKESLAECARLKNIHLPH
jgi:hypothetical protein